MNDHFKLKATQLYIMENSKKFSKPPSSLNIARKIEGGSGSSGSTPSEDYKTPSLERDTIPGFEFGNREGEPEGSVKPLFQKQDTGVNQPVVSHNQLTAFPQERTSISTRALPKGAKVSRASSQSVSISSTRSPMSHVGGGQSLILNGSNVKTGMDLGTVSKHSDQSAIVPLMRSPPSARQMKKASFSALPNQTTWLEETAQRGSSLERDQRTAQDSMLSPSTELSGIRRKLEERRKQIENEKKKMEMQWSKQRQQVGKEAFIQVVTKNHLGSGSQSDLRTAANVERPAYNREVSDGELMQVKQQERRSRSPALHSCEVDEGRSVTCLAPNSSARSENVKELKSESFGSGQLLLSKNSANSGNSDKRTANLKEIMTDKGKVSDGKGSSDVMNTSAGYHSDISEYGTSLDRLNSSLSELQGEIMRLSLQQDQIKSLVGSDLEPALISNKPFSTPPQSSKAQFYLYPRNTTDMTSGTRQPAVSSSTVVSSVNGSAMPSVCASSSTGVFGLSSTALTSFPGSKTFANPLGFMNPGMSLRGEMYPAGTSPMNARYANQQNAYALYYPMPHVPYLDGLGYPMPMTNSVCPSVSTFPISQQGSVNYPVQNFNPYAGPWQALGTVDTAGISGDNTATELTVVQQVPSSCAIPRPGVTVDEKMSESSIPSKNPEMTSPSPMQCDLQHSGPMNYDLRNFPPASASLSSPGSCISSTVSSSQTESKSSSIPSSQDEAVPTSAAPNEAFFMVLDSDLPRRPKPVLSTSFRKKETLSAVMPDSYSVPADGELKKPAEELSASNSAPCDAAPSIGFVIGGDESSMNQVGS